MEMKILEFIQQPWPWYIAGPLIGLMVPVLLIFDNKKFGVSSTMRDFCAYVVPNRISYFKYNLKENQWRNIFVLGILLGGAFVAVFMKNTENIGISAATISDLKKFGINDFSGIMPSEIFSWNTIVTTNGILFILIGGFFVGFGTRYADGCTSGHAIMGLSLMSPASLLAVIGFFAGGLFSTNLLFPLLF